ncbi:uncharacterized protein LOC110924517 [Helianthus annuus]|uniref:uncharacterized protein LOC110924517 n=1 Tax=Helianthus annuus TaxID=4232 RepID=UPI00165301FC|nr:uncharacterized protein LOC110924517 [Helianthus annuus]
MDNQDFYNLFSGVGATQSPTSIMQNINLENELGTMQKPPKLMSLDEYSGWSGRFKNWVQANHLECWIKIERKYVPPVDGLNMLKTIASLTDAEQIEFKAEKKMVSILQQAIKEDILVLLQHDDSAQSIWQALEQKFKGSASMIKSKKALIKKEFDIFTGIKGESTKKLIESSDFVNYSLSVFIEKIEAHELELVKIKKMNSANMPQDVSLYYKNSPATSNVQSPKIQTGFSADNTSSAAPNAYQSSQSTPFANYEPNVKISEQNSPQSSTGQAIYHRPNQQPAVQRPQIENKPEKALIVNQDDEKVASGFSWDKYVPGNDDQAMMAEVVEITETVAESKIIDEEVTEVAEEVVTEMVDEVSVVVVEEVVEIVDQVIPEVVEKVSTDSSAKAEESVTEVLNFQSRQEEFVYTMKSILPPNVFDSFADYFEEPRTGTCPRFEAEKEEVEEMIDVSKEMTEEALKEIADKALMSKLKEVDSDIQESVDKVSVLGEEIGVLEVKVVKSSESESIQVGKVVCEDKNVLDDESENSEKANSVKSVCDSEEDGNFLDGYLSKTDKTQTLKVETVTTSFVEYDKRVCYRCNEIGHMAKQCQKVFKKPVVGKSVQNQVVEKPKVEKPKGLPKSVLSRWIMDSGASRHMTGSLALLYDVKAINGSYVGFVGNQGGRIVGQGKLTNGVISFDKVNYIVELTNNFLSISQICDKDFSVHFTKSECLVLKPGFKVPDELVLLRAPRVNDLYIRYECCNANNSSKTMFCYKIKSY